MEYNLRKEEKFCIFTPLEKNLNRSVSADLKAEFVFLQNEGVRNLIVDLSNVEFIDSDGLSALLMARRNFTDQKGSFVITGEIQSNVLTMFKISKLSDILNIIQAEEEAIEFIFMEELEKRNNRRLTRLIEILMSNYFTALGTSAAIPTKSRSCSAYYLQLDGDRVLIDCGEGTQRQLIKYVQNGFRLTKIFISHSHADHVLGLPGLLFSMNLNGRNKKLDLIAPSNVLEWVKIQIRFFDIELNYSIEFIELNTSKGQVLWRGMNFDFVSFPLDHTAPCAGLLAIKRGLNYKIRKEAVKEYRLNVDQIKDLKSGKDIKLSSGEVLLNDKATFSKPSIKLFAYVSDTRPLDIKQSELLSDVHHMIHESTFCEDLSERAVLTGHSTAKQSSSFAKESRVKHLYLTHFSSRYQNPISFLEESSKEFEDVTLLTDGQKVSLSY